LFLAAVAVGGGVFKFVVVFLVGVAFVGVVIAVVKTTFFVDDLRQRAHKHSPLSPDFTPFNDGITMDMYSEKKRSPLSSGNTSANGNGTQQPTAEAKLLTYHSSE